MSEQIIFGPEAAKQIAEAVRGERRRLRNPDAGHRRQTAINEVELLQGFLAGDLDAATNATNGQTTATLNVWYRDAASGALVDGGRTIEVTNRDVGFERPSGAHLQAIWIEGEWRPLLAASGSGPHIQFTLNYPGLARTDAAVEATVQRAWGGAAAAADDVVTVYNHPMHVANNYIFSGEEGFWGTAVWDDILSRWWIVQMECGLTSGGGFNLNTWTGSPNLTTVGTIDTGEWNGEPIAILYGGNGADNAVDALANLGGQPLDATLTALGGLTIAANSLTIGTGAHAFSQTTFAANTLPGRSSTGNLEAKPVTDFAFSLLGDASAATARATLGSTMVGDAVFVAASAAAARTALGLVIGTDVQAFDAELSALAGLASAADTLPYFTGSGAADVTAFTAYGRSLVGSADASEAFDELDLGTAALANLGTIGATVPLLNGANTWDQPNTFDSNVIVSGDFFAADQIRFSGIDTPGQITANQNDYAINDAFLFRLSTDASRTITGIAGGAAGAFVVLANIGSFNLSLATESASSGAGSRFAFDADLVILPGQSALLVYDGASSRWRLAGGRAVSAASQGGTGLSSYTVGDLLYASGAAALAKLADVATGSVLVSGGVGVAPAWSSMPQLSGLGIGAAAVANEINLVGGSGVFLAANVATDATNKNCRWGLYHYLAAEEPFFCFIPSSSSANNIASFGGGSSLGNAATRIDFWTAPTTTTTTGNRVGSVGSRGNLLWGTLTSPTAGDGKVIVLGDNAANPTMGSNTAGLFGKDVSGTVEVFAVDEGGAATQLSEHAQDAPDWLYDDDGFPERVSRVEDPYTGQIAWVNRSRLERLLERQLSGDPLPTGNARTFRHRETFATYNARLGYPQGDRRALVPRDWDADQSAKAAARQAEIDEWETWNADRLAAERDGKAHDVPAPYAARPVAYSPKPKPPRLRAGRLT